MNQGNAGNYENNVGKDGALIIQNAESWTAVFLAFAEQEVPTDDGTGKPAEGAKALETIVGTRSQTDKGKSTAGVKASN